MIGPPDSQQRAGGERGNCDCADYVERVLVQDVMGAISGAAQRISSLLPGLVGGFISNRCNLIVSGGSILLNIGDRKSTRLNSSHGYISYAVFCLKKKNKKNTSDINCTAI